MVTARIEFKPGRGSYFCPGKNQDIIELKFETVAALIDTIKPFRKDIYNCTAEVSGKIVDLRNIAGLKLDS